MSGALLPVLWVFVGGGAGAAARYGVGLWALHHLGSAFPWSTFIVNGIGSCLMGLVMGAITLAESSAAWRLFIATGFLGGFTTFSTFSLDAMTLVQRGELAAAAVYIGASVGVSLSAVVLGFWLVRLVVSS